VESELALESDAAEFAAAAFFLALVLAGVFANPVAPDNKVSPNSADNSHLKRICPPESG
jgi:hypothetical protein